MTGRQTTAARAIGKLFAASLLAGSLGACIPGEIEDDAGVDRLCGSRALPRCARGEFCDFPESAQCGAADAPGVCTPIPTVCTREYRPVCGCDGRTYGNACMAAAASMSVASEGECPESDAGVPEACGGIAGIQCPGSLFCDFPIDAQCGAADRTGTCRERPEICTLEYAPVCGCDDRTYSNACAAAAAGVSVQHQGECRQ